MRVKAEAAERALTEAIQERRAQVEKENKERDKERERERERAAKDSKSTAVEVLIHTLVA
jgi:ribosomal protein S12 methylthiotransferase accessory factor YcaO